MRDYAKTYTDSLNKTTGHITLITDRDVIIAVVGAETSKYFFKAIGKAVKKSIFERTTLIMNDVTDESRYVVLIDDYDIKSQVIAPIISQGEPIGTVVIANNKGAIIGDTEVKLAETAADFLARLNK